MIKIGTHNDVASIWAGNKEVNKIYLGTYTVPVYEKGDILIYSLSEDGTYYKVVGVKASKRATTKNIIVPETHEGLPVTTLEGLVFQQMPLLETVTIPNSVVDINKTLFTFGYTIFNKTTNPKLKELTIPFIALEQGGGGVNTELGHNFAVKSTTVTTNIDIPASLKKVIITNETKVKLKAFYGCKNIEEIIFYDGLQSVATQAFFDCPALKYIEFPKSVTTFSYSDMFSKDGALQKVILPFIASSAITSASSSTLFGYGFGTGIYTGGVRTVQYYSSTGNTAYYIPSSLKDVTILKGNLLYGTFWGCSNIKKITIGNEVNKLGDYLFKGCSSLDTLVWDAANATLATTTSGANLHKYEGCTSLSTIEITDNVITLPKYAFYGCESIEEITIPKNITSIDDNAFSNCTGLTTVYWNATDCTATNTGNWFSGDTNLTTCVIGENVKTIPKNFMKDITTLTNLTFEEGLENISDTAFNGCTGLTGNLIFPDSIVTIGNSAFKGCSNIETVTIPEDITSIGSLAFNTCAGLTTVYWNATDCAASNCFTSDTNLTTCIIGENVKTISANFMNSNSLETITIPEGLISIGNSAFANGTNLTSVYWNATNCATTATSSTQGAFKGCSKLTTVTIADNVEYMPSYAFYSAGSSTNKITVIAESATPCTLGTNVFSSSYLNEIRVPMAAVDTYKAAPGWSTYASKIVGY